MKDGIGDRMYGVDLRMIAHGVSALSFTLNLAVLVILIWKGGRTRPAYLWWAFMGLIAMWCMSELFIRMTDDFGTAMAWFRLILVAGAFTPAVLLHFALEFPHRHPVLKKDLQRAVILMAIYLPTSLLLIRAELMSLGTEPVPVSHTIWGDFYARDYMTEQVAPDVYIPHYFFLAWMLFAAIFLIFQNLRTTRNSLERKQLDMMAWVLSIVFIPGVIFDTVLSVFFKVYTELFSVLISFLAVVTAVAMVKHKFLIISPASDDIKVSEKDTVSSEPGMAYIVPMSKRGLGIKMFRSALAAGREGIVITNRDPASIRSEYGIERTPIVHVGGRTEHKIHISPDDLDSLVESLLTFAMLTKAPVVVLDWDDGTAGKGKDGARPRKEGSFFLDQYRNWFKDEGIKGMADHLVKSMANGMSVIVFQKMDKDGVIETKRPLQHLRVVNRLLIEELLSKVCSAIAASGDGSELFPMELAASDKYFAGWKCVDGLVRGPDMDEKTLDRRTTVLKLRTIYQVLSRSRSKGARAALASVWNAQNLGGYPVEEIAMPEGTVNFLVNEDKTHLFDVVEEFVAAGHAGLCMSTKSYDRITQVYGNLGVDFRWITNSETSDKRVTPISLEYIRRDMKDFISGHKEGVIYLDGIELLISRLGFEDVQRFLHVIKDEIALTRARLFISVHPAAIGEQRLALMQREIEI